MTVRASINAIEYFHPDDILTNEMLVSEFPDSNVDKIADKTGIQRRYISRKDEYASDLGAGAARKLFESVACAPEDIDYLLYCTQSPDYLLPTTACILQDRLKIPKTAGAIDFNLGCSGYVYGLGLAKGLIESGQVRTILLITADTISKYIHPGDKSVRALFGDAATATLLQAADTRDDLIGPFLYGTDGAGAKNLMVEAGGLRRPTTAETGSVKTDKYGNLRSSDNLFMNGGEIFQFALQTLPGVVKSLLEMSDLEMEQIDLFVFHQASLFMLDGLRKKIQIPEEKFVLAMENTGNTTSSTIPIALKSAETSGQLKRGMKVMLVGFGVGYSWGATLVHW